MKQLDMTTGKIQSLILSLAIPIIGSSLLQFTYNFMDMLWVGGLGSYEVASVGSASFYLNLGYALQACIVVGSGVKIAHAIGSKDDVQSKAYIQTGMFLNFVLGIIFIMIFTLFGQQLLQYLGIQESNVIQQGYFYLLGSLPMIVCSFFNTFFIRVLQNYGIMKQAFYISCIGMILNMVLDPILIYIFKFGVLGSAIGSSVGHIIMFLMFLDKFKDYFLFSIKGVTKDKLKQVLQLGIPMTFQRVLFTLVNIILAKLIAQFGAEAIAAQKIGLQIESIMFMVIGGCNGAIASFTGQNFGAKLYERVDRGYRYTLKISIVYACIALLLFLWIPNVLASIFVRDDVTILIASNYLRIVSISQLFSAIEMISNGYFTGIGKPKIPAVISIVFTVLRIPFAMICTPLLGINGIWLSISISSICKGIIAYCMYHHIKKKELIV